MGHPEEKSDSTTAPNFDYSVSPRDAVLLASRVGVSLSRLMAVNPPCGEGADHPCMGCR